MGPNSATGDNPLGTVIVRETGRGQFQQDVIAGPHHLTADEPIDVGGLGSAALWLSAVPGPSSSASPASAARQLSRHAAQSMVVQTCRASLSQPASTFSTVSPSMPLSSRNPAGGNRGAAWRSASRMAGSASARSAVCDGTVTCNGFPSAARRPNLRQQCQAASSQPSTHPHVHCGTGQAKFLSRRRTTVRQMPRRTWSDR